MKEHILIIRFSAIGDVAMAVPVVYSLAKTYPKVRITVLSREYARPFFDNLAPNVSFMEADLKGEYHGVKGLNRLYRRLTAKNFTAVADFHNVLRSDYLRLRFNLGRYPVEHIDKHRKGRKLLTMIEGKKLVQQPTSFQNYADTLARLGYPVTLQFRSIFPEGGGDLSLLPEPMSSKPDDELWIGIAPFAAHRSKTYPPERMHEVISLLAARHSRIRIFLFGRGNQEEATFSRWTAESDRCVYVGRHLETMRQELILISRLNLMVSMDSANMHLAAICGIPVVSVWGATHPFAGFLGWNQSPETVVQTDLPCRPCSIYGNKPCVRGDFACMMSITPEQIADKVDAVLSMAGKTAE
ncbi:MAG: glycosyltransferase family 9 protein [Prevotella sp.]|nr:glycosyltransferase family 9 protein [Prevotella sp.]